MTERPPDEAPATPRHGEEQGVPREDGGAPAADKETGRLEAFSDGVFAVAVTLLVLDLKVPSEADLHGRRLLPVLLAQWPMFLAYFTSFLTVLVMWVNHHTLFTHIRRSDHRFLYINGMLLLLVTFVPFATALVAEHIQHPSAARAAAGIYAGAMVVLALIFNLLWRYAARGDRLLAPGASRAAVNAITRQYRLGPLLYLLAFLLSFVSVAASLGMCLGLALFFALTGAFIRRAEGGRA